MPEIIFDNCVLSNFALSDSLNLIKHLYSNTSYITDLVMVENLRGVIKGHQELAKIREAVKEGWLREITLDSIEEKTLLEALCVSLGFGEASAIAAAKSRGLVFACDDRAARREAVLLGVKLTGTIGILAKAVRRKLIKPKRADEILRRMITLGFYSPIHSIREVL
jgi:predicted nucleic acid-binding protein